MIKCALQKIKKKTKNEYNLQAGKKLYQIFQNVGFSKIDITMTTINKKL